MGVGFREQDPGIPNNQDLYHDYLWRCVPRPPERGRIGLPEAMFVYRQGQGTSEVE